MFFSAPSFFDGRFANRPYGFVRIGHGTDGTSSACPNGLIF